jgi:hypothetical protein
MNQENQNQILAAEMTREQRVSTSKDENFARRIILF